MNAGCGVMKLRRTLGSVSSGRRMLTTLLIAVGSSLFLMLAGCASAAGIEPRAALLETRALGEASAASPSVPAPHTGIEPGGWRAFADPQLGELVRAP